MANYKYIAFHQQGPIAAIILNRPEAMNALSPQLIEELRDAVKIAGKDPDVGVVIVTGAGRAWSAGIDLKAMNAGITNGTFTSDKVLNDGNELMQLLQTMPKPTIAAVNGFCLSLIHI